MGEGTGTKRGGDGFEEWQRWERDRSAAGAAVGGDGGEAGLEAAASGPRRPVLARCPAARRLRLLSMLGREPVPS